VVDPTETSIAMIGLPRRCGKHCHTVLSRPVTVRELAARLHIERLRASRLRAAERGALFWQVDLENGVAVGLDFGEGA
jgi:hypothetical protein